MRAALLVTTCLFACSTSGSKQEVPPPKNPGSGSATTSMPSQPTAKVYLQTDKGEVAVDVEVVNTEAKIEKGLMYREHLPPENGMLFMMGEIRVWTFWMKNTLIPLDMIFIGQDMTVAGIVQNAEPLTETLRKTDKPSLYVLEVNGGYTAQHGVSAGAKVRFENVPK